MAEWKTIKELFNIEKGSLQSSKCIPGDYPFITAAEEWKTHESYTHDCEALIFAMAASGSLGRTHYIKGKFISSDLCFIITPKRGLKVDLLFYYRLFNFLRRDIVKKTATGTSKLSINQTNFGAYKLPYFDYDHQATFRGKIETLAVINDNFFVEAQDQLDLIKKLRLQVLQEAVQGKLTANWRALHPELISGDNHASKLLENIKTGKERLIKEGKIRKEKPLAPISDEEKPYNLPEGWVWCRLGEICTKITDGFHNTPPKVLSGVPYISATHVKSEGIDWSICDYVSEIHHKELWSKAHPEKGEILVVNIGAGCGTPAVIDVDFEFSFKNTAILKFDQTHLSNYFLIYFLLSVKDKNYIEITQGGLQPFLSLATLNHILLPLPPLAEQQAIVESVNEIISMIKELETQISERKKWSGMLMQSVLREAFATS